MWLLIAKILMSLLTSWKFQGTFGIWSPNLNPAVERPWSKPAKLPEGLSPEAKIAEIRDLSPWKNNDEDDTGTSSNVEVCFSEACLTQALHVVRSINFSVDPCDNFFEFACGNWIRRNSMPGGVEKWGKMWKIIVKILISLCTGSKGVFAIWNSYENPLEERPWSNPVKFPEILDRETKLAEIQKLLRPEVNDFANFPQANQEICVSNACLDQALHLLRAIDFSADPCTDFYNFACGNWMRSNPIPESYGAWDVFSSINNQLRFSIINILKSSEAPEDGKPLNQARTLFSSCMDTDTIEKAGLKLLLDTIEKYGGMPLLSPGWNSSKFRLSVLLGDLLADFGLQPIFQSSVAQNVFSSRKHILYLDGPTFYLSPVILGNSEAFSSILAAYKTFFVDVFTELAKAKGLQVTQEKLESAFRDVYNLEMFMAKQLLDKMSEPKSEEEEPTISLGEYLQSLKPILVADPRLKIDWEVILERQFKNSGIKYSKERQMFLPQSYLKKIIRIVQVAEPETVANYVMWRLILASIQYTTKTMVDIRFNFTKIFSGARKIQPRENTCAQTTLNYLGYAVSGAYVRDQVDNSTKPQVNVMIENLRIAFIQQLKEATWLSQPTLARAIEKATAIVKKVAYPDWFDIQAEFERLYSGLNIVRGGYFQSIINSVLWATTNNLKLLDETANRTDWNIIPAVVNAVYEATQNSITFPAGILRAPLFTPNGLKSINYGGIGMVMGHEITHGFDTGGSFFNAEGNYGDWWEKADRKAFNEKADCFRAQYSSYNTSVGNVNGNLTVGENIADNGGVNEAYRAYQNWIHQTRNDQPEARLFGLVGFSPEQLFFLGFSQGWCGSITPNSLADQLRTDVHSPDRFRVIGSLQNSQDFAKAWRCKAGQYMNPLQKCKLW